MVKIIPSIASANLLEIGEEIKKAEKTGRLHLDIEDGNFSTDITFGLDMAERIAGASNAVMDAHLMTAMPVKYIPPLLNMGIKSIAFHIESVLYPWECISEIRRGGGTVGAALNYKTPVSSLAPYMEEIDYVLLQSAEAGDPGQTFRNYMWEKIKRLEEIRDQRVQIWVDGGVTQDVLKKLFAYQVDYAVMGRGFFNAI